MTYDYQAPPESYFPTTMQENDDLHRCMDGSPHVVAFWNAVCAFINHEREHGENPDRVLECPSWGQWRSIGQHYVAGRKVQAIKLLRASTCAWTKLQPTLPANVNNTRWRAFMAANALPAWDPRGGLTLSEAKGIIDTLEHAPHWFGNDANRVFNPLPVTCAEPVTKVDLKVPGEPERSLWLNIYRGEKGHDSVVSSGTRAEADGYAMNGRIACINITYKDGEGL